MNDTVNLPVALTGGVVYLLMALTVWGMGRRTPHVDVVRLWTWGGLCASASLLLIAGRNVLPLTLGFGLAGALVAAAMLLQSAALRSLIGRPRVWWPLLGPAVAAAAVVLVLALAGNRQRLFVVSILVLAMLTASLAWHARQTALRERSRSAMLLAWSQATLALALLARALTVAAGLAPFQPGTGGLGFTLLHGTAVLTALYANLGFMGLLLDITRRAEARALQGQVAEATRREAAEQTAQELRALLQQRDALSAERERLLQMLAHEIRQPLHNASGALQAAGQALQRQPPAEAPAEAQAVAQRLGRAEAVLREVRSVLDNTLAAATLLSRSEPLAVQEVDLDFLVDLALGDLDAAQRSRVQVQWLTDLRQAEVEPGLLRLALRNLLRNAFGHGGPAVVVRLQVAEQTEPPALLLQVVDDGPGLPAAAPAPSSGDRRPGLGLDIVRQVMALHGGRLDLHPRTPQGLAAVLVLPLPADGPAA